jgi:hypothetical protein
MLRKLLIGPVLTGAGWIVGSYYGAEAQQVVHKSPSDTYDGISRAIDNMHSSGTTHFEGGTPMPYEIRAERTADQQLVVHLVFDGHEGATTELHFVPQDDGKDTMVSGKVHTDRSVLRQALAGTSSARLAYAPDWMLNLLMVRPLLQKLGQQIEQGQEMQVPGMSEAEWESSLSPDQQRQEQEWRQYDASRPTVDPDADAARFMNQH